MKIGVISDTHLSPEIDSRYLVERNFIDNQEYLYDILDPHFRDVDAIIHAGDITNLSVIESLKRFSEVYAIAGNMDSAEIHHKLEEKKIIELGGFYIGVIHGWGSENGLTIKVRQKFNSDKVDCIIFGHSHKPYNMIEDNILMFNPGSPTDKRFAEYRTIGILYLEDKIHGEHIRLE